MTLELLIYFAPDISFHCIDMTVVTGVEVCLVTLTFYGANAHFVLAGPDVQFRLG